MAHSRIVWWWLMWPGLRPLWLSHSYPALALAVGSGLLLNLLLSTEFVWTEWLSSTARLVGWLSVLTVWIAAAALTWYVMARERQRAVARESGEGAEADPLSAAIDEYLQGKWYEAERLLRQQIRRERNDIEALLMLATLCRRTERLDEAERRLDDLAALEAAGKWEVELAVERRLLQRRRTTDPETESSEDNELRNDIHNGAPDMTRAA